MKQRHFFVLSPAFLLVGALAVANGASPLSEMELGNIVETEASWTKTILQPVGYEGSIESYVTDKGRVRIAAVPSEFRGYAEMDILGEDKVNANLISEICRLHRSSFEVAKERRIDRYFLRLNVNPFGTDVQLASQGLWGVEQVRLENPVAVNWLRPELLLSPDSISSSETGINVNEFNGFVDRQIKNQWAKISRTGQLELDLTGWDDVACDLVSGKAVLQTNFLPSHEYATIQRRQVITSKDFGVLYDEVRRLWKARGNVIENHIVGSAILGAAMANQLKRSPIDFQLENFVRLHFAMFQVANGQLKQLQNDEFEKAASALDVLERRVRSRSSKVIANVKVRTR